MLLLLWFHFPSPPHNYRKLNLRIETTKNYVLTHAWKKVPTLALYKNPDSKSNWNWNSWCRHRIKFKGRRLDDFLSRKWMRDVMSVNVFAFLLPFILPFVYTKSKKPFSTIDAVFMSSLDDATFVMQIGIEFQYFV